jgi:hypothetical protein
MVPKELLGPGSSEEELIESPGTRYFVGVLAPRRRAKAGAAPTKAPLCSLHPPRMRRPMRKAKSSKDTKEHRRGAGMVRVEWNQPTKERRKTMSLSEVVIEGTLKPDGTLELDQKPNLSPGRVTVVLRQEIEVRPPPKEDWWQYMQRARRELEAMNYPFMNEEEVTAWIQELRADEDRIETAYRQAEEAQPKQE